MKPDKYHGCLDRKRSLIGRRIIFLDGHLVRFQREHSIVRWLHGGPRDKLDEWHLNGSGRGSEHMKILVLEVFDVGNGGFIGEDELILLTKLDLKCLGRRTSAVGVRLGSE